jgi:DNA-binding cell septation regulator SpoVG
MILNTRAGGGVASDRNLVLCNLASIAGQEGLSMRMNSQRY